MVLLVAFVFAFMAYIRALIYWEDYLILASKNHNAAFSKLTWFIFLPIFVTIFNKSFCGKLLMSSNMERIWIDNEVVHSGRPCISNYR